MSEKSTIPSKSENPLLVFQEQVNHRLARDGFFEENHHA